MTGILELDELKALAERGEVDTIICAFPDHWGRLVGKRLRMKTFFDVALSGEGLHGSLFLLSVDMEMEPREGYAVTDWARGFPDFRFVPDLATLRLAPWLPRTAIVICDLCEENSDELIAVAPRSILRRQIERARARDLSVKCATELEFYLYRNTLKEAWDKRYEGLEPISRYRADYHIFQGSLTEDFTAEVREALDAAAVDIEFSKPEWGLGQQEINLRYADALEMADRHVIFKLAVKEIAARQGWIATFMAKPYFDEVGSSCHLHVSLWNGDGTRPLGWDQDRPHNISETFSRFLGGSIASTRDFTAAFAPTINSYKRLQPETFAPTAIAMGEDNRTCSHRLVGHGPSFRFENRVPGADVQPYIAIAASIAGGLHGIENGIDAPEPYDGNAYTDPGLDRVATTLMDAVAAFENSEIAREALDPEVWRHLLTFYRTECDDFLRGTVTDWERIRYFERI